jgi:hypothetical protein
LSERSETKRGGLARGGLLRFVSSLNGRSSSPAGR